MNPGTDQHTPVNYIPYDKEYQTSEKTQSQPPQGVVAQTAIYQRMDLPEQVVPVDRRWGHEKMNAVARLWADKDVSEL